VRIRARSLNARQISPVDLPIRLKFNVLLSVSSRPLDVGRYSFSHLVTSGYRQRRAVRGQKFAPLAAQIEVVLLHPLENMSQTTVADLLAPAPQPEFRRLFLNVAQRRAARQHADQQRQQTIGQRMTYPFRITTILYERREKMKRPPQPRRYKRLDTLNFLLHRFHRTLGLAVVAPGVPVRRLFANIRMPAKPVSVYFVVKELSNNNSIDPMRRRSPESASVSLATQQN